MALTVRTLVKSGEYHDSVRVMETGILPQINTGIGHKKPRRGHG
ncbi:MAG: hypothetical protein Q7U34_02805 [Anaerolineales bacterium]|nr:hypothetical protein [Anaerolineales bacterium]MDP3184747.1 hypothetical protein [Anaerolineales bacterium]